MTAEPRKARPVATVLVALVLCALALVLTPLIGAVPLDLKEVFRGVEPAATIFFTLRLPRVLLAALAGGALATAGTVFQTLLRNDLATPFTLGVASGGSLGAVAAIHFGLTFTLLGLSPLPVAAFAGAALVVAAILGLVRLRGPSMESTTLLLAGVTVSFLCSATIMLLQYLSDFTATHRMIRWMMGGLDTVGYGPLLQALPFVLVGLAVIALQTGHLNQLLAGDLLAASRGVPVRRVRVTLLLAAALITAAVIAFTGPIGFVGLIVPHGARLLGGANHRALLPASFLGGAALLPVCDMIARTVIAPAELPVGVLTALLGAPFFLFILLGQGRGGR